MCNYYQPEDLDVIAEAFAARWSSSVQRPLRFAWVFPRGTGRLVRLRAGVREIAAGQWGAGLLVRQDAEHALCDQQRPGRGADGESLIQAAVESGAAVHHPGGVVRRALLGNRSERLARVPANGWHAMGAGGVVEHLGRQGDRGSRGKPPMLTLNANHHPVMRRMNKPDTKLPPDGQDKRSVIPLDTEDYVTIGHQCGRLGYLLQKPSKFRRSRRVANRSRGGTLPNLNIQVRDNGQRFGIEPSLALNATLGLRRPYHRRRGRQLLNLGPLFLRRQTAHCLRQLRKCLLNYAVIAALIEL